MIAGGYRWPMMTNATAATPDPVAAALAIIHTASREADGTDRRNGIAAIALLGSGIIFSLIAIAAMISSPATIPMWCAAHGGCM
jgi:hypothetical protein